MPYATKQKAMDSVFRRIKVDLSTGCWNFQGGLFMNGYGKVCAIGKTWSAHRLAYEINHGEEPKGLVLHSCDNKRCVNPDHLRLGSSADNTADCRKRGRLSYGHDTRHISLERRDAVIFAFLQGKSRNAIVRETGVGIQTVRRLALLATQGVNP